MTPVLRVIVPTANVPDHAHHNVVRNNGSSDYITNDTDWPVQAQYVARMNESGQISVLVARSPSFQPAVEHTYLGWPIPA